MYKFRTNTYIEDVADFHLWSKEVHILHSYKHDFYGKELRIAMLGYIRPEYNYTSVESLIQDIEMDKKVTTESLRRPAYEAYLTNTFFE